MCVINPDMNDFCFYRLLLSHSTFLASKTMRRSMQQGLLYLYALSAAAFVIICICLLLKNKCFCILSELHLLRCCNNQCDLQVTGILLTALLKLKKQNPVFIHSDELLCSSACFSLLFYIKMSMNRFKNHKIALILKVLTPGHIINHHQREPNTLPLEVS